MKYKTVEEVIDALKDILTKTKLSITYNIIEGCLLHLKGLRKRNKINSVL